MKKTRNDTVALIVTMVNGAVYSLFFLIVIQSPPGRSSSTVKGCCKSEELMCNAHLDLAFVTSLSAPHNNPLRLLDYRVSSFIRSVVRSFHISSRFTRIGFVTLDRTPKIVFDFQRYSSKDAILHALHTVVHKHKTSCTHTGKALHLAQSVFTSNASRAKVLVLITDQRSCDDVMASVRRLKKMNVRIFTIGIGRYFNGRQLEQIASRPPSANVFTAARRFLAFIREKLVRHICLGVGGYLATRDESCPCDKTSPQDDLFSIH
ncbi:vitrin isoform X2 [Nematostella vectensis]|uniref:vitrin isoform X2 n=1 Tax=Nematostella vectensis TaxID=45351 RepID=UPI00207798C7|nr:vitrin isoform X2 [Nematostella vectensis]